MDFNKKILDKIDKLVKLSNDFDNGFKIVFNLTSVKIDEKTADIIYIMTKNYILMREEHGELLLMMNKLLAMNNIDDKKSNNTISLYDISTFSTLINNINDLINNIDYQYKKIALKYPKFINKKQIIIILIIMINKEDKNNEKNNEKYIKMIDELIIIYPEHKYNIIKYNNEKNNIIKCDEELNKFNIKIKSTKSLPLIYIINDTNIIEVPISKIDNIEPIKNLLE
jgi:hypothetical protein